MSINHRRITLSVAANLLLELINKISPLFILHHAQKTLGLADFGWAQYQLVLFETFQPLITYGYSNFAMSHAQDNDPKAMRTLQSHIFVLKIINAILVLGFFVMKHGCELDPVATGILLLVVGSCVADSYWICVVRHKLVSMSLTAGLLRLISLALILTLVRSPDNRGLFVLFSVFPNATVAFGTFFYAYSDTSLRGIAFEKMRQILIQSTPFALVIVFITLLDRLDMLLVEHWYGIEAAGIYAGPAKIIQSLSLLLTSIGVPFFAETRRIKDAEAMYKHIVLSLWLFSVIVAPIVFGLPFVENAVVELVFPKQPADAAGLLSILSVGLIGSILLPVFGVQLLLAKGKAWSVLQGGMLGLMLIPVLIWFMKPHFGLQAVAYGTALGKIIVGLGLMVLAREFVPRFPFRPLLMPLLAGFGMWTCLRILNSESFLLNAAVGSVSYVFWLALGNFRDLKALWVTLKQILHQRRPSS